MSDDILDEFGFPLSLSEQFRGRTMRVTNIRPQSSATQDEDWYEEQVPRHRNESTAAGPDPIVGRPEKVGVNMLGRSAVDTTTACIGRLHWPPARRSVLGMGG